MFVEQQDFCVCEICGFLFLAVAITNCVCQRLDDQTVHSSGLSVCVCLFGANSLVIIIMDTLQEIVKIVLKYGYNGHLKLDKRSHFKLVVQKNQQGSGMSNVSYDFPPEPGSEASLRLTNALKNKPTIELGEIERVLEE